MTATSAAWQILFGSLFFLAFATEWVALWRERPPVVWDYEQQRWRSARRVVERRKRGGRRAA